MENKRENYGMTKEQFEEVKLPIIMRAHVSASDFDDQTPRTLLLGENDDKNTFHVYLDEKGFLNRVVYQGDLCTEHTKSKSLTARLMCPSGHVFPETTDFTLAVLLRELDVVLPYSEYQSTRQQALFYGRKAETLIYEPLSICA
ncbi:hypothetical protein [Vibrio owensii]|uniref:hypothetical protein n=1 Tax=Vibrio harveyi group TaxID=717610 RepID=UPI003CC5DFBC